MKIYTVKVEETFAECVHVEAESEEDAIDKVANMHREGEIFVENIDGVDYCVVGEEG